MNEALRHDQSRWRAVVDTAVDGVILINAQGIVLVFNPACENLFGYAAFEVIGRNVKVLMPESYAAEHDSYLHNYRETGVRKIIGIGREVTGRKRDGTTFPMDLSVGEAEEDGEPIFVGVIRDLTERKAAEQALREGASRLSAVVHRRGRRDPDRRNRRHPHVQSGMRAPLRLRCCRGHRAQR